mgnify:CR=1 FL=1
MAKVPGDRSLRESGGLRRSQNGVDNPLGRWRAKPHAAIAHPLRVAPVGDKACGLEQKPLESNTPTLRWVDASGGDPHIHDNKPETAEGYTA